MPRKHRNPFIPFERAKDMEDSANIAEKESKQHFSQQQAKFKAVGAPLRQKIQEREKQKQIEAEKAAETTKK